MALFGGKESKEAKKEQKILETMKRRGLDDMDPKYWNDIKNIMTQNTGVLFGEIGSALGGGNPAELSKDYLSIIQEQNWIIIRLLNDINKKLDN